MGRSSKCHHEASSQSTLRLLQVESVGEKHKARYSCECTVCKRMTDWYLTRYEAQVEAWYECWMEEYA